MVSFEEMRRNTFFYLYPSLSVSVKSLLVSIEGFSLLINGKSNTFSHVKFLNLMENLLQITMQLSDGDLCHKCRVNQVVRLQKSVTE